MPKKQTASQKKIASEMKKFAAGKLHSGSKKGPIVKSREQAIAISLSVAKKKKGK